VRIATSVLWMVGLVVGIYRAFGLLVLSFFEEIAKLFWLLFRAHVGFVSSAITNILSDRSSRIDTSTLLGKRVATCVIDQQVSRNCACETCRQP
jgi:hypothetical protein